MSEKPKKPSAKSTQKPTAAAIQAASKRKRNIGNDAMAVTAYCPGGESGTPFTQPVEADTFFDTTKQFANDKAYAWALQEATRNLVCVLDPIIFRFKGCSEQQNQGCQAVVKLKQNGAQIDEQVADCGCSLGQCSSNPAVFQGLAKDAVYEFDMELTDGLGNVTNSSSAFTAQGGLQIQLGD